MGRMLLMGVLVSVLLLPWGYWPAAPPARADVVEAMCTPAVIHQAVLIVIASLISGASQQPPMSNCSDQRVQTLGHWVIPMGSGTLHIIEEEVTLCVYRPSDQWGAWSPSTPYAYGWPPPTLTPTPIPTPTPTRAPGSTAEYDLVSFKLNCSVLSAVDQQGVQRDLILGVAEMPE